MTGINKETSKKIFNHYAMVALGESSPHLSSKFCKNWLTHSISTEKTTTGANTLIEVLLKILLLFWRAGVSLIDVPASVHNGWTV